MTYEEAVEAGYDGPSPSEERRIRNRINNCNAARGGPDGCGLCISCRDEDEGFWQHGLYGLEWVAPEEDG